MRLGPRSREARQCPVREVLLTIPRLLPHPPVVSASGEVFT